MNNFSKFSVKSFASRGFNLTAIELKDLIPFEVKRVYYTAGYQGGEHSGEHCHKEEQEVFVVVQGGATAVIDKGQGKEDLPLVTGDAIYVSSYIWHGFKDTQPSTVLLAFSSTNYRADRSDYIEDYNEYLKVRDQNLSRE